MLVDYFVAVWDILLELAPWLLLGAAAAGALHVLLPADFVKRHLQGRAGVAKSVFLGVPLPLCSCGVIPVGLGMKQDGASDGAAVGFLIATPQTGVDSVLVTASFLGWPFAVFKVFAALVTGLAGGWLADGRASAPAPAPSLLLPIIDRDPPPPRPRGWRAFFDHALMILESIWRWLAIGVLASAAITVLLPDAALSALGSYGGLPAMLAALVVSLPLYVCATASVPMAAALVAAGLPTGAALVFLMAGPATNVATIGAVGKTLGRRALVVYLSTIIVGSIGFGLVFNWLLAGVGEHALGHVHAAPWWAVASAVALAALMLRFALGDLRRLLAGLALHAHGSAANVGETSPAKTHQPDRAIEVAIDGMHCQSCVNRVAAALNAEPGIAAVQVTLDPQRATVHGDVTPRRVCEIIESTGFAAK
ncbi:MAG: permease [Planctomycetales bacterium]|nr:permease [Planctomycetales bacterium]